VRAVVVATDVTKPEQCARLAEIAGETDVLINNAGFAILDSIAEAKREDLHDMMETNYFGTVNCTKAFLPRMLERGNGAIVNVASIVGIMPVAQMGGYGASKAAVIGFTETLRDEVLGRGVRVSMVCPATTESEFFVKAERGKMPGASKLLPTLTAEDVARAVCNSAEDGRYRRILPLLAHVYMRLKEFSPRFAHLLMRRTSALLERR
jgi:short-subunit dehydrogenase